MNETALRTSGQFRLILALALFVRAICWTMAAGDPQRFLTVDALQYMALADDLRAGYLDPSSETFVTGLIRTPLYPMFLGALLFLFHGSVPAAIAAQILLALATIWLTCALADRLVGRRAALVCGLVLALDPVSALFSCLVQPETLFTLLLVAGVSAWLTALERGDRGLAAGAGLLLGLAALTRPIGLFIPLCLSATALLTPIRRRAPLVLILLLTGGIPIGAWSAKNWLLTGFPVFSIAGHSSLFDYRAAGALAEDEGISLEEARARIWQRLLAIKPVARNAAELSSRQRGLALTILAEHPRGALKMMLRGVTHMMTGTGLTALSNLMGDPSPADVSEPWKQAAQALQALILAVVYLAVARGVYLLWVRGDWLTLGLTLGAVAYLALLSAGPEANTRFRFPATPFLAILAGLGFAGSFTEKKAGAQPWRAGSRNVGPQEHVGPTTQTRKPAAP